MKTFRSSWPAAVAIAATAALVILALNGLLASEDARAGLTDQFKCVFVSTHVATGGSNWKQVDARKLAFKMEEALESLAADGYRVITITPITRGRIESQKLKQAAWGGGYGMTQGLLISAEKP